MSVIDSDIASMEPPAYGDAISDYRSKCTWESCGLNGAYFRYRPHKGINLAFAVIFGVSALVFLLQGLRNKKWLGFTIAMIGGCALEVVGYVGRYMAYEDLWSEGPFLIQIVCLTIAPAFLAAGVYLCLKRIVLTFGRENSRISPRSYPRIFIACDFISLVLQAAGGGIASVKVHNEKDPKLGNNIMIAGLAAQVATLLIFILLALDFGFHTVRRMRELGAQNALDPQHASLRKSRGFKFFLIALSLSTILIFTRCVFRVAELSDGWEGPLIKKQGLFIGLEGAVILAAVLLLVFFHPILCFKAASTKTNMAKRATGQTWYGRKERPVAEESRMGDMKSNDSNHVIV